METNIQNEESVSSIYSGTMPQSAEQGADETSSNNDLNEESLAAEKKKYHSSAMYAASKWHNTVNHVKTSHRSLDL